MDVFSVNLNQIYQGISGYDARLDCYILGNYREIDICRKHTAVLIFPGGGYGFVSAREAEPVALKFLSSGFNAFVLTYTASNTAAARFPVQLLQAFTAIAYIRENAEKHNTDAQKLLCCGFSAGGHLAASAGCFFEDEKYVKSVFNPQVSLRPDGLILCYPVISAQEKLIHRGSFYNLTGEEKGPLNALLSLENRVSANTPPAFVWHTRGDKSVPCQNSVRFCQALAQHGVRYELKLYPGSTHGVSLATGLTAPPDRPELINKTAAKWFAAALKFFGVEG